MGLGCGVLLPFGMGRLVVPAVLRPSWRPYELCRNVPLQILFYLIFFLISFMCFFAVGGGRDGVFNVMVHDFMLD